MMTRKVTMKNIGPILIANSISPCTSRKVPSKALLIMVVGWIREVSTFNRFKVDIGQTFKADLLSISTLATIISSHFTIMCIGKVYSLPSGGSSSSVKEIYLVANAVETIPSKVGYVALVGTHVSFKTFKRALWWTSKDSNSAKMEIWADNLFSYWITLYSEFLIIFKNSSASSIVTLFLTGSVVPMPISFLLFSSSSG